MQYVYRWILLAGVAAIGLASAQIGQPAQPPGLDVPNTLRKIKIEEIQTEGNRTVHKTKIFSGLHLEAGKEYTQQALQYKVQASIHSLHDLNYFTEIAVDVEYPDSLEGVVLVVRVEERPTLGKVRVTGNETIKEEELREKMRLIDGQMFSQGEIEYDRQQILSMYEEEGFPLADVEVVKTKDEAREAYDVTFKIDEGKKVKVRHITFKGNQEVSSRKLRGQMEVKEKSWFFGVGGEFKEEELYTSLDSIIFYYKTKGYLDASVASHDITYSRTKRFIDLEIEVFEGNQYQFGDVTFVHNDIMDERALQGQMMLDKGETVDITKLDASKFQVEALFRNVGYLFVQVQEERSYRDSILDITYTIREGNIAHVNKIHVRGNTKTKDKVIRRELHIYPGDMFSQALVMRSQREVMQLNFFDQVMPNYEPVGEGDVDLIFEVQEKEAGTGTFSAGAAFSGRDGLVGTLGLQIPNFLGNGQRADLNLEWGGNKQLFSVGFTEPWFLDTPTLVGGSVFWQSLRNFNYISSGSQGSRWLRSYGFRTQLGRRLTWPDDYFSVSTNYNLVQNENGFQRNSEQLLQQSGLESSLGFTVTRDDKDLPVFPTDGSKYIFSYKKYGGLLGGNFNYEKYETRIKWWFPTVGKLVFGLHSEFGIMDGPNLSQLDLYQMGGTLGFEGKLRGYHSGAVGRDIVGRSYLSLVSELTYPVAERLFYLLGFFDMGNVYGDTRRDANPLTGELDHPVHDLDFTDLLMGYGVGFRLIIPMMGRIGFDFARHIGDHTRNGAVIAEKGWDYHFVLEAPFD